MESKRATIEDIAREAQVGLGTVSRVLNNSRHVSEETRRRVLDVVKARQYTPSAAASRLARRDMVDSTIGLLLPDVGNHFFFEIFESIYRKFRGLGIDLLIFSYEKHNKTYIQKALNSQPSAMLIFAFLLDEAEQELLRRRNIRYLYIDYYREKEHCIYTDNVTGGKIAARYLLDKGVSHPCYIAVDPPAKANEDRFAGFSSTLAEQGINRCDVYSASLSEAAGYEVAKKIIAKGRYDGIFCYCDDIATGVLQAVREEHAAIRVIGYDGVRLASHVGLSTVSQDPSYIGDEAARLIVQIMNEPQEPQLVRRLVTPTLIDRDS